MIIGTPLWLLELLSQGAAENLAVSLQSPQIPWYSPREDPAIRALGSYLSWSREISTISKTAIISKIFMTMIHIIMIGIIVTVGEWRWGCKLRADGVDLLRFRSCFHRNRLCSFQAANAQ